MNKGQRNSKSERSQYNSRGESLRLREIPGARPRFAKQRAVILTNHISPRLREAQATANPLVTLGIIAKKRRCLPGNASATAS